METKPYSLQSPEQIAKDYGGNKQKIANAAQMGLLDPTAAVMAGMFIDRMRSAQQQEQQPQQTVAQQVFSPQPPAPPPGAPPVGAAPQGAPPQQPMPQQGGQPPMGMAGGGLMDLSIDPSMFDEPSNGAYAGGGLVAFADGGDVDEDGLDMLRRMFMPNQDDQREAYQALRGVRRPEPTARPQREALTIPRVTAEQMRAEFGTPRPPAPAPAPRRQNSAYDGPPMTPEAMLAAMGPRPAPAKAAPMAGSQPQAAPAPARGLGAIAPQQAPAMPPAAAPAQGAATPAGPERPTLTAAMDEMKALYGDLPTSARDAMSAYWERMASPEAIAAQKKQDMWSAMAQMGFNMASSNSPYFLQAVGQAGAQAVPAMQAAAKERRAMEREGLQARAGIESQQRAERGDMVKGATSLYGTQLQASESAADRASREKISSEEIAARIAISAADNATSIRVAQIGAGARGGGGDGGVGARKFSSSMPQRLAQQHYEEAMSLMMQAVAANPEAQRAYAANPEAYRAKYERRAYQLSLEYGARRAAEIGGNGGSYTNPEQQVGGRTSTQGRPPLTSFDR